MVIVRPYRRAVTGSLPGWGANERPVEGSDDVAVKTVNLGRARDVLGQPPPPSHLARTNHLRGFGEFARRDAIRECFERLVADDAVLLVGSGPPTGKGKDAVLTADIDGFLEGELRAAAAQSLVHELPKRGILRAGFDDLPEDVAAPHVGSERPAVAHDHPRDSERDEEGQHRREVLLASDREEPEVEPPGRTERACRLAFLEPHGKRPELGLTFDENGAGSEQQGAGIGRQRELSDDARP